MTYIPGIVWRGANASQAFPDLQPSFELNMLPEILKNAFIQFYDIHYFCCCCYLSVVMALIKTESDHPSAKVGNFQQFHFYLRYPHIEEQPEFWILVLNLALLSYICTEHCTIKICLVTEFLSTFKNQRHLPKLKHIFQLSMVG